MRRPRVLPYTSQPPVPSQLGFGISATQSPTKAAPRPDTGRVSSVRGRSASQRDVWPQLGFPVAAFPLLERDGRARHRLSVAQSSHSPKLSSRHNVSTLRFQLCTPAWLGYRSPIQREYKAVFQRTRKRATGKRRQSPLRKSEALRTKSGSQRSLSLTPRAWRRRGTSSSPLRRRWKAQTRSDAAARARRTGRRSAHCTGRLYCDPGVSRTWRNASELRIDHAVAITEFYRVCTSLSSAPHADVGVDYRGAAGSRFAGGPRNFPDVRPAARPSVVASAMHAAVRSEFL